MRNRKSIMTFAGLEILFFHLWVYLFPGNEVESFLKLTAYVGVDIFFLLSAYSIGRREIEDVKGFYLSRFTAVYLKFVLFAVAACLYSGWKPIRLLKVICGIELFQRGGGAFLWFLPAIMIFYLLAPLLQKGCRRSEAVTLLSVLAVWLALGLAMTKLCCNAVFIFWNRIPVLLLGFWLGRSGFGKEVFSNTGKSLARDAAIAIVGTALLVFWGYKAKLMSPIRDMFYVAGLPAALGLTLLLSAVPEIKLSKLIGSSTLEMYGIQMVFGYKAANYIYSLCKSPLLTNLFSFVFVCGAAIMLSQSYGYLTRLIDNKMKK